ncbi:uncharacterized protein [Hetaerina americana]|uniref:uncharacterized protein n=1 Tax=Hetaerina americana TaxID=62018 RepID=UPI003A7F4E05
METPIYTKPSNYEVITVIQRQAQDPEVWGRKTSYVVGENLEVNCTSSPSHPPAHITWLVNGRPMSEKSLKWFRGQWPHPYHHRNHGHHGHHHNLHHHQNKVPSEEDNSALVSNGDLQGLTDGDGLDGDLEHEPAVLPALSLAAASSTVQLTYQITEENALEAIESEENEASSSMKTSEEGMVIGGRISLTCLATIPAFLGAGAKENEYEDHRMTSVDVDIIIPVRSVTEEEEQPVTEEEKEAQIFNGAPRQDYSSSLVLVPMLPLFAEILLRFSSPFSVSAIDWLIHKYGQLLQITSCILKQGCPCR